MSLKGHVTLLHRLVKTYTLYDVHNSAPGHAPCCLHYSVTASFIQDKAVSYPAQGEVGHKRYKVHFLLLLSANPSSVTDDSRGEIRDVVSQHYR